ncbi:MAG: threonine dehydratase [Gammaproteobacteria bacterium]|nr:threonine dehydratase [Gammaproteobacteria bacterium]
MEFPTLDRLQQAARVVHAVMAPTPQICWPQLCARLGTEVWVKHENHTQLGAFKIRGGIVYFEELRRREPDLRGVVVATRGNHGQSIAYAARRHGFRALIVVPHGNSLEKNAAMRALGADIVEHGTDFVDAFQHAQSLAVAKALHMVPSFDEALVRGVASYSLELLNAVPDIHTLYVPIGLGSGICGAMAVRDALRLQTEIVGVVAEAAPAYARSFDAGRVVPHLVATTIADGVALRVPDQNALESILRGVARIVTVTEHEIRSAMRTLFSATHNVAEGAGAIALAAAMQEKPRLAGRRIAIVQSGGNVDRAIFARVLLENDSPHA